MYSQGNVLFGALNIAAPGNDQRKKIEFPILKQDTDSIIFKIFEVQCNSRTKKNWVSTILDDLKSCKLNVSFADIQNITKVKWKSIVKQHIREKTQRYLLTLKQNHS